MKITRKLSVIAIALCMAFAACSMLTGCNSSSGSAPELKEATLSTPAIGVAGKLRVGVNTANSPLAGMNGQKIIGIDVDIAAAMADEMGLAVEIVDVGADFSDAIANGEIDVALGVEKSSSSKDYWMSDDYIPTGVALFALEGSNVEVPKAGSKPKIAAQVSSKSAWAVTNTFGADSLVSTTDLSTAIDDLVSGEAGFVASDAIIGMYAANRQGVDVKIAALIGSVSGYCAVVAKDNSSLQEAVKTSLATIKGNGIIDVIEDKWLGKTIILSGIEMIEPAKDATAGDNATAAGNDAEGTAGKAADGEANAEGGADQADASADQADAETSSQGTSDEAAAGESADDESE